MFCPKCSSILMPRKDGKKTIFSCSCGFKTDKLKEAKITERLETKSKPVEVVDEQKDLSVLPKMKTECPKCGHNTAYFWTMQTRAGDEPETKFLKCEKCKHTWRDYD